MSRQHKTVDPNARVKGRGVSSNVAGRFENFGREYIDDGWEVPCDTRLMRTQVAEERPKSALTSNDSPDIPFDRSLNPYRGCEHGCSYCFARPSHAFLGMSPGLDFETQLIARPGIDEVLSRELRRKKYEVSPIAMGTNTDPYQPIEKKYQIMPRILRVMRDFNHPVGIVTKGSLIERDVDILAELASEGLAHVGISITSLEKGLSRALEPRAPMPDRRLAIIEKLAARGIPVRVMVAPVIPGLTDHELENIIDASADAGASAANYIMLRLPGEVADLFQDWLSRNTPDRAARVMARVREMHGGKNYSSEWGHRMRGEGHYADLISHRFKLAVKRAGIAGQLPELNCDLFRVPGRGSQLELFG